MRIQSPTGKLTILLSGGVAAAMLSCSSNNPPSSSPPAPAATSAPAPSVVVPSTTGTSTSTTTAPLTGTFTGTVPAALAHGVVLIGASGSTPALYQNPDFSGVSCPITAAPIVASVGSFFDPANKVLLVTLSEKQFATTTSCALIGSTGYIRMSSFNCLAIDKTLAPFDQPQAISSAFAVPCP